MTVPFLGEIRMISFNFPPKNWALCNGQVMPINQNQALFALLGATYGGDGRVNFALPDLRGRIPMGVGVSGAHLLGEKAGEFTHTLSVQEMPSHSHVLRPAAVATVTSPANAYFAAPGKVAFGVTPATTMSPQVVRVAGGNLPHPNMPPYLALNFAIALTGVFPSQY